MTHRVEQIMDAFEAAVTGLATAGTDVKRDDAYQFDDSVQAAIRLHQGACIKLSQTTPTVSDWALTVYVLAVGKETPSENALTVVNRINREIVVAMNLAVFPHLGLSFVQEVEENDALPVEVAA